MCSSPIEKYSEIWKLTSLGTRERNKGDHGKNSNAIRVQKTFWRDTRPAEQARWLDPILHKSMDSMIDFQEGLVGFWDERKKRSKKLDSDKLSRHPLTMASWISHLHASARRKTSHPIQEVTKNGGEGTTLPPGPHERSDATQ